MNFSLFIESSATISDKITNFWHSRDLHRSKMSASRSLRSMKPVASSSYFDQMFTNSSMEYFFTGRVNVSVFPRNASMMIATIRFTKTYVASI